MSQEFEDMITSDTNSKNPAGGNILDKIVLKKREEIEAAKLKTNVEQLKKSDLFSRDCYVLRDFILDPKRTGIIAEFKRQSPSKGIINDRLSVEEVTNGYAAAGASALSVLTDRSFFGGKDEDLLEARKVNKLPLLRKDFMLDEYQIIEAKALGADIILLIAAILTPAEVRFDLWVNESSPTFGKVTMKACAVCTSVCWSVAPNAFRSNLPACRIWAHCMTCCRTSMMCWTM